MQKNIKQFENDLAPSEDLSGEKIDLIKNAGEERKSVSLLKF